MLMLTKSNLTPLGDSILFGPEREAFHQIEQFQITARLNDKGAVEKPLQYVYPDPRYSTDYIESLYRKVRTHNRGVENCKAIAVGMHQLQWAKSYQASVRAADGNKSNKNK